VQLHELHRHWRVALATGNNRVQRGVHRLTRRLGLGRQFERMIGDTASARPLSPRELWAARRLASETYFEELERALRART
jgi:hypothetical protein